MSTPELALDRLCLDAREVAEYVCKRLSRKKLILVGQSWEAELGLHVVKRWPELFYAFVGTGQPVSWSLKIEAQERWAKAQAAGAGDDETLKALSDTASLPMTNGTRMNASRKYILSPSDLAYVKIMGTFIGFPSTPPPGEAADRVAGGEFTSARLSPIETSFDARRLGLDISIPFFVIQGREDHIAPSDVAQAYLAEVRAPKKAFIPIAGGHYACLPTRRNS